MAQLSKGKRISGDLRSEVSASFVERYRGGESIRSIATESGRSYGFVQGLLKDSGVEFRSRGGARNRAQPTADAASEPASDAVWEMVAARACSERRQLPGRRLSGLPTATTR